MKVRNSVPLVKATKCLQQVHEADNVFDDHFAHYGHFDRL